ncbi:hypothetical protein ACFTSF_15495 [Kribbella sp. NPDC056951]|uniref:hypothetical protein n=1 Tax=Kribbella sp. NPDC056951 TaxID=3345978 RepID=UPI00362B5D99
MKLRRTLALMTAVVATSAGLVAVPAHATTQESCTAHNTRVKLNRIIRLIRCANMPDSYGRIKWYAELKNGSQDETVMIRYRGRDGYIDWDATDFQGYAYTRMYWGNENELQACASLYNDGFYCAWTANDVG